MLAIQNVLVSDEIIEKHFVCSLEHCKGACCWEGDLGAPLKDAELQVLDEIYPRMKHLLSSKSQEIIETKGAYIYYKELDSFGTNLHPEGPCTFLIYNELGVAKCGIEKAWELGLIPFRKPISCHLYPIRVTENPEQGFIALNYDVWSICKAACNLGKKLKIPLYLFLKDALIRKFGPDFYDELAAAAQFKESEAEI
jgi:hypothetical protein